MQFRPRYSLLTLLFLTALVAGGVKLWYGPHRVVETDICGIQVEYTYTRDWSGNWIEQGPFVLRTFKEDRKYFRGDILFMRNGSKLPWIYKAQMLKDTASRPDNYPPKSLPLSESPLNSWEQNEFQRAIDQELELLSRQFKGYKLIEYQGPDLEAND